MLGVEFLACWHVSKLVLDNCEHLSNGIEDAAGEFVLIIDR
mgnify:CR=1 FL=1